MKSTLSILSIILFSTCLAQEEPFSEEELKKVTTEDIVSTISKSSYMVLWYDENSSEEEKNFSFHIGALHYKSYDIIDSLFFITTDDILKINCFGKLVQLYPDSLGQEHLKILENKNTISIDFHDKNGPTPVKVGDIATRMHQDMIREKENAILQKEFELIVKDFILGYAANPKTYEPISFFRFSPTSEDLYDRLSKKEKKKFRNPEDGTLNGRVIRHTYKLSNKEGKLIEVTHVFDYYPNMKPMLIGEVSSTMWCSPPKLDEWFNLFGRELSANDSTNLGI